MITDAKHEGTELTRSRFWHENWLFLPVFIGLFLPFINKAFHIDDVAFLNLASMIGWNPLVAIPQDYFYQGTILHQLLPYEVTHPPLIPYLLKIGLALFGENEMPLHLMFLVFPAASLWFLNQIRRQLAPDSTGSGFILLLLFSAMPAFLVNAQNLMTDVATLCFLLGAISYFLKARAAPTPKMALLGGLFLSLAVFSSYQALAFIPLLTLFTLVDSGLKRFRLTALLAPVILMGIWLYLIYSRYDIFPLLASKTSANMSNEIRNGFSLAAFQGKTIYLLATTGLMTLLPLIFNLLSCHKWRIQGSILLVLSLCFYALLFSLDTYSNLERASLAFLMACGVITLSLAILSTIRGIARPAERAVNLLLCGWIVIVVGYNILLMPFGAARYLLPLFPPLYLLLLESTGQRLLPGKILTGALIVFAILFGFLTAASDYSYANSYRTIAAEVAKLKGDGDKNRNFWYIGEWGMRIYFDRAGARYLLADSQEPKAGDYIIMPEMPRFWVPSTQVQFRSKVDSAKEISSSIPLRLFNRRSNAGFYSHLWGYLPLAISTEPDEIFTLLRVVR